MVTVTYYMWLVYEAKFKARLQATPSEFNFVQLHVRVATEFATQLHSLDSATTLR
jgi:hypothetical protein